MTQSHASRRIGASSNFSEIITEYRLCALPSDDVLRGLATAGVDLAALVRRWQTRPLDVPRIDRVIFDDRGGFEFARYRNDVRDAGAMIFIVRDHIGDAIDLAAWGPPRPPALWIARGSMLGSENLFGFRMREALEVHPTPLEWLRAGCQGVVIIDPQKPLTIAPRSTATGKFRGPWACSPPHIGSETNSHSGACLCRQEGGMNELVDLEQAERILASSPVQRLRMCQGHRRPAFISWGPFTMNSSGLTHTTVRGKGTRKGRPRAWCQEHSRFSATPRSEQPTVGALASLAGC